MNMALDMNMTKLTTPMAQTLLEPIRISLRGIEGLGRKSMAFLLSSQKSKNYLIVDEHPDAIIIIDIDDYRGKAAWEKLQDEASQDVLSRVIVLGLQPVETNNAVVLQKPFRPKQLLSAIDTLLEKSRLAVEIQTNDGDAITESEVSIAQEVDDNLQRNQLSADKNSAEEKDSKGLSSEAAASLNKRGSYAFLGTAADVDLDNLQALSEVQYNPEQFLCHHFQALTEMAAKEKKYIHVSCCEASFYIDPFNNNILTQVKEKKQRSFGAVPLGQTALNYEKLSALPENLDLIAQHHTFKSFIWRMALAGSRGRLPTNTDIDQRYRLRRWPNLTRLVLFPHATQISALWMGSEKSIREVITTLAIPQRYVFAFFAAAHAIGFLQPVDTPAKVVEQAPVSAKTAHKRRGLFSRLLKTLNRKQQGTKA